MGRGRGRKERGGGEEKKGGKEKKGGRERGEREGSFHTTLSL